MVVDAAGGGMIMSKTEFTPGPWAWSDTVGEIDPSTAHPLELVAFGEANEEGQQRITTLLDLNHLHEMKTGDAHLIASAPDLYEALELMSLARKEGINKQTSARIGFGDEYSAHGSGHVVRLIQAKADAALSKGNKLLG
jgi:hypothetical protein